jgi:acyl dehydratase/NAD(P)-dependent dehydrogenase (short-subunit alcohol dehydrogenase family)
MSAIPRVFDPSDQAEFARLSGDCNPLHLDPMVARRTQLGACVVHGMHLVLWALDSLCRDRKIQRPARLRIRFMNPIFVGEQVLLRTSETEGTVRAELAVDGGVCASFTVRHDTNLSLTGTTQQSAPIDPSWPMSPVSLAIEQMAGREGTVAFATPADEWAKLVPSLCSAIGPVQVAALACTSRLVGMVCPGLYSIFASADLALAAGPSIQAHIAYRTVDADPRTRVVSLAIQGGGIEGTADAFVRQPPVQQPKARDLRGLLDPAAMQGTLSLIVGGSRGIGEVAAKIIAGSGGRVLVGYASGRDDALRVAEDISSTGGTATTYRLDVRQPLAQQLRALDPIPSHACHFATPQIFGKHTKVFDQPLFENYCRFYVSSFWELCQFLAGRNGEARIFYPSSVAVEGRPRGMTEYAMAKVAGEQLCDDINRFMPGVGVVVKRLPRILTDQTATVAKATSYDVVEALLPSLKQMFGSS